ncbi:hypothetical protein COCC4DRAFT_33340, partial [Bipolaris maydis ATCC 48331]
MPLPNLTTAAPPKSSRSIVFHISELYHPLFLRLPVRPLVLFHLIDRDTIKQSKSYSRSFAPLGSLRQFVITDIGCVSYLSQDSNCVW